MHVWSSSCCRSQSLIEAAAIGAAAIGAAEISIRLGVAALKRDCPWIITDSDLTPAIDPTGLDRFMDHGWDQELGWIRKPNTAHDETGQDGATTRYHINASGSRRSPSLDDAPLFASVYGDSYAFARQVNDDETWAHRLGVRVGGRVANFGVGNYGMDQAQMRMEREYIHPPGPLIIMAVVPETICRCLSVWKHFSEYGNTFAFKPRFNVDNTGTLTTIPNPVRQKDDFFRIPELLPQLVHDDFFYERKFRKDMLRPPYLWYLTRSGRRNLPLILAAMSDRLAGGGKRAFCQVMERNISLAAELYKEDMPVTLLAEIARRFATFALRKGARPALVLIPQLYELHHLRAGNHFYRPFIDRISPFLKVIDLGPHFAEEREDRRLYIDDRFGGHLSVDGNQLAAEFIDASLADLRA